LLGLPSLGAPLGTAESETVGCSDTVVSSESGGGNADGNEDGSKEMDGIVCDGLLLSATDVAEDGIPLSFKVGGKDGSGDRSSLLGAGLAAVGSYERRNLDGAFVGLVLGKEDIKKSGLD